MNSQLFAWDRPVLMLHRVNGVCGSRLTPGAPGHVLLAGCLHQFGERRISVSARQVPDIVLEDQCPCQFIAHEDEWVGQCSWHEAVKSPLRMTELLRREGISHPLSQPWRRMFLKDGRTGACKGDAVRAALSIREQAGLVRSRGRYGARVAEEHFDKLFRQIRPNQEPQPRVQVEFFYKLCPVLAGATEASILQWARQYSWQVEA